MSLKLEAQFHFHRRSREHFQGQRYGDGDGDGDVILGLVRLPFGLMLTMLSLCLFGSCSDGLPC